MNRVVAILCSGQGGQHAGMFDLFASCAAVEPIFAAASELLGQDPRHLVRAAGPALFEDRIGQMLCCTQALAAWGHSKQRDRRAQSLPATASGN